MKICKICKIEKSFEEFGKRKAERDGLDIYCHSCRSEYYKNKQYNRHIYQSNYKRVSTEDRKLYLRNYMRTYRIDNSNTSRHIPKTVDEIKQTKVIKGRIYKLLTRVLRHKKEIKISKTEELLGWTKLDFIYKFGELLNNKHIDHKIPISWFISNTPIHIVNSLENLQILDIKENLHKSNKFAHTVSADFLKEAIVYIKPEFQSSF